MTVPILSAVFAMALLATSPAQAQNNVRVRGAIIAVDANTLTVKSRDGRDLKLILPQDVAVGVAKAVRFEDIMEGDFVGTTTKAGSNGTEIAVEVHFLPPTANQGQSATDLLPNSRMTNASVQVKVSTTGARELALQFGGGVQKVVVPDGTPIVRTIRGSRADFVPGEYVFITAQGNGDGALTALRIQVSKDGVRPPQ